MSEYSELRGLEYPVWFRCPELGYTKANHPLAFSHCVSRMFYAFGIMADIPDEKRVSYLDFGSGGGAMADFIAPGFQKAIGVEPRPEARAYAQKINSRSGISYVASLAEAVPHAPFDFITFTEVIEHMGVEEAKETLRSLSTLLSEDGLLFLTTPPAHTEDGSNPENHYHVHEYSAVELRALLEGYFKIVKVAPLGHNTLTSICTEPIR